MDFAGGWIALAAVMVSWVIGYYCGRYVGKTEGETSGWISAMNQVEEATALVEGTSIAIIAQGPFGILQECPTDDGLTEEMEDDVRRLLE